MALLLTFFLISISFSFLCSIWEAVLLSIPPSYVEIRKQSGDAVATHLEKFKKNIDRPLAAILTLNTIAHTGGAIGVGAQASKLWASASYDVQGFSLSGEAIVAALMTLAILILSEIIPKTLGANYWKRLTGFTVFSLRIIIAMLYPLVWVSQGITKLLKKDKDKSVLSRADFSAIAEMGAKQGIIEENEHSIIKNLLRFDKIRAKDIMTPRTVVVVASEDRTLGAFYDAHPNLRFSRIPVYRGEKDEIVGFFLKDDLLNQIIEGKRDLPVSKITRNIRVVDENASLPLIFEQLIEKKSHIAVVADEYGGMAGIVSMEDIMETLLGLEIMDEMDSTSDMQQLARENWRRRAQRLGLIKEGDKNEIDGDKE